MRRISNSAFLVTISLVCFFMLVATVPAFAEINFNKLVKNTQSAVVTVMTYDKKNNFSGLGSGFFVDRKGHLITNYHVLRGAYKAEVRLSNGKKYPIGSVVAENGAVDLIKVLVDIPGGSPNYLKHVKTLPSIAERIFVIGSPLGLEQTVSEGIVSAVRKWRKIGQIIQISAPISSGSSGGPVLNMKGQVVGVTTLYYKEGQNLNFAVPCKYIAELKKETVSKTISEWSSAKAEMVNKWFKKGILHYSLKQYDDAIEAFTKALELSPQDIESMYHRGIMWYRKGEWNRSIDDLTKVLKMSPEPKIARNSFHVRGIAWVKQGDSRRAITEFTKELELLPGSPRAHYARGHAWLLESIALGEKEDYKAANEAGDLSLVDFRKALSGDPDNKKYQEAVNSAEKMQRFIIRPPSLHK